MIDVEFDNVPATGEGWGIFDCEGSDAGRWQLQKVDEEAVFSDDIEAWRFVGRRAAEGSAYHQTALDFLKQHNPAEYELVQCTL